ncbi:MAG: S41 family peptidase, partial [bacterium]
FVLSFGWYAGTKVAGSDDKNNYYKKSEIFRDVLFYVRNNYVDKEDFTAQSLIYGAIDGMLDTLGDPYSRLMRRDQYNEMKTETNQEFGGLGIYITIKNGDLTVIAPIEGTPAFEAGLLPGDVIKKIDGEPTKDITKTEQAVDKLRGPKGSKVRLTIDRAGKTFDVSVTRGEIKIKSVHYTMVSGKEKIGYIKIRNFGKRTHIEIAKALKDLHKQGMEALLLDLRNNPGGLLRSAFRVADRWVRNGRIVYTRGRDPDQNKDFKASKKNAESNYPMAVLVNGGSASGSEIVTGALKDHDRAVVMGDTTFGKGLVQSVYQLEDGSALALTTAYYYTPDGHQIQDKGIPPHIRVKQSFPDTSVRRDIIDISQEELVVDFVRKHPDPSNQRINQFIQSLREKGYDLDRKYIMHRIKKKRMAMEGKNLAADPTTDPQLAHAIKILSKTLDLSPWSVSKVLARNPEK